MKPWRHFLTLVGLLLLGTALRFWNLDAKPLWLDEVITALFSLGRSYYEVPLDRAFPLSALDAIFTLKPASCAQIVQTISVQSVHPPLFFCWLHQWLTWVQPFSPSWVWALRSFPAVIGAVAILAVYQLNRAAFSPAAGLMGAGVMAVSPFAVYLSQEARHYTLPMLLVTLALLGLYQMQTDLQRQQVRPAVWFGWIVVNSLGFYVHYFFLLAFVAQVAALLMGVLLDANRERLKTAEMRRHQEKDVIQPFEFNLQPSIHVLSLRRSLATIALTILGVCLTYAPWLPTLLSHTGRPETDWMKPFEPNWTHAIAPLYQLPLGWVLMVIALPVENQPAWVAVPAGGLMLLFAGWLGWHIVAKLRKCWQAPTTRSATRLLVLYVGVVVLEFLAIAYLLDKDLTQVPRYNFIYFPAVCALLGVALNEAGNESDREPVRRGDRWRHVARRSSSIAGMTLLVGVLSSVFVVHNVTFQKPYYPTEVADNLQVEPQLPLLVGMSYEDLQDVALGLSFALALRNDELPTSSRQFAFLSRSHDYTHIWQTLPSLQLPFTAPLSLWIIGPDLRRVDFPAQLMLTDQSRDRVRCLRDSAHYHRIGIPYQRYQCDAK